MVHTMLQTEQQHSARKDFHVSGLDESQYGLLLHKHSMIQCLKIYHQAMLTMCATAKAQSNGLGSQGS